MDKKVLLILVGTICFGLGVGVGVGVFSMKNNKTQINESWSNSNVTDKQSEINEKDNTDKQGDVKNDINKDEAKIAEDNIEQNNENNIEQSNEQNVEKSDNEDVKIEGINEWRTMVAYSIGSEVQESGNKYRCIQAHTALEDWEPSKTPALWELVQE
ncbi:MAG: carbohydrate-binding protein [Cellulosilyticaceae bacterium]